MSSVSPRVRRALVPLFALLLLAAGCGSGPDQPAATGDVTTTTADTGEDGFADPTTTTEAPPAADCSAATLPEGDTAGSSDLDDAVVALRIEIMEAALACDVAALEELALEGDTQFTYSFGGSGSFAAWLQEREQAGEPVTQRLVQALRMPSATTDAPDGEGELVIWPSVAGPEEASEEDWAAVAEVYTPEEVAAWRAEGSSGFLGYRVGITSAGDWLYFVAGD